MYLLIGKRCGNTKSPLKNEPVATGTNLSVYGPIRSQDG